MSIKVEAQHGFEAWPNLFGGIVIEQKENDPEGGTVPIVLSIPEAEKLLFALPKLIEEATEVLINNEVKKQNENGDAYYSFA